jgi:hypothetical protein
MARISRCAHLKPTIDKLFLSGKMPHDVVAVFSELPLKTAKDWHQALIDKGLVPAIESEGLETVSNVLQLIHKEPDSYESESDIEWAKVSCKRIYNAELSSVVRLQALGTFLKAVQLESILKKEDPDTTAQPEPDTRDYSEMSESELAQLYRDKLG